MKNVDLDLSNLSVLVISHISDLAGPTEALESFLKKRAKLLALIYNPLEYCTEKKREIRLFERGKLVRSIEPTNIRTTALISWITDVFVTIFNVFRLRKRYDVCIGVNGLNALIGLFFRALGRTDKVIFYTIDWVERRFSNPLLNRIYHFIDRFAARHSDFVWNISRRIVSLREKQEVSPRRNVFVPVGVDFTAVPSVSSNSIDRKRIVFLGALERTKGIELVIDAWNEILERVPDAKLVVIGKTPTGAGIKPYEEALSRLKNVELKGVLPHSEVLKTLPTCGVGLAPYSADEDSITKFADPSRVKDYLACGLPVVITPVPEISQEIADGKAGIVIEYDTSQLVDAVQTILKDLGIYQRYSVNARKCGVRFSWDIIFERAFSIWLTQKGHKFAS
ncbi:MAG: glycosyltransferase [Actinobacteria bacterium]|nr:glycosyltransferase [Actinomycetota bacterium]